MHKYLKNHVSEFLEKLKKVVGHMTILFLKSKCYIVIKGGMGVD